MSEAVDIYQQEASSKRVSIPWVARLQEEAQVAFETLGFPGRRVEDWKYTSVEPFLKHTFSSPSLDASKAHCAMQPDGSDVYDIRIENGVITCPEVLPTGVIVLPLIQACESMPDKVQPYLGQILAQPAHGFQALNMAMLGCGLFIFVPEGVRLDRPVRLTHIQDKSAQAVYSRHVIVASPDSELTFIEAYEGEETQTYFTNTITELFAHKRSTVTHYKIQQESKAAYHVGHTELLLQADSEVRHHTLSFGGHWVRSDVGIRLVEPLARCLLNGLYAPGEHQHIDHHTTVSHEAADCRSDQDYKGILAPHSRAVFNGKIYVAKDAQHTEACQQNKNLLLGEQAEIDTKPQLEIYADDVVCTHGATVGQLDEEALFYLATRGIERDEANRYLIQAFASDNLQKMAHEELAGAAASQLLQLIRAPL